MKLDLGTFDELDKYVVAALVRLIFFCVFCIWLRAVMHLHHTKSAALPSYQSSSQATVRCAHVSCLYLPSKTDVVSEHAQGTVVCCINAVGHNGMLCMRMCPCLNMLLFPRDLSLP